MKLKAECLPSPSWRRREFTRDHFVQARNPNHQCMASSAGGWSAPTAPDDSRREFKATSSSVNGGLGCSLRRGLVGG
jgi:hypothetical protein